MDATGWFCKVVVWRWFFSISIPSASLVHSVAVAILVPANVNFGVAGLPEPSTHREGSTTLHRTSQSSERPESGKFVASRRRDVRSQGLSTMEDSVSQQLRGRQRGPARVALHSPRGTSGTVLSLAAATSASADSVPVSFRRPRAAAAGTGRGSPLSDTPQPGVPESEGASTAPPPTREGASVGYDEQDPESDSSHAEVGDVEFSESVADEDAPEGWTPKTGAPAEEESSS